MALIPTEGTLTSFTWIFLILSVALTAGRFAIRHAVRGRFLWDDYTHGFAVILLIALSACSTAAQPYAYQVVSITCDGAPQLPLDKMNALSIRYQKTQAAVLFFFWTSLWVIKITFLLLYRLLFEVSVKVKKWWWVVLGTTVASYSAILLITLSTKSFGIPTCDPLAIAKTENRTLQLNCVLNVASDLMILVISLPMLKQLQIRPFQKAGLAAIFSLVFVILIFDILRTVKSSDAGAYAESSLWCILEANVAVIVSCLPTYRTVIESGGPTRDNPRRRNGKSRRSGTVTSWGNSVREMSWGTMDRGLGMGSADLSSLALGDHGKPALVSPRLSRSGEGRISQGFEGRGPMSPGLARSGFRRGGFYDQYGIRDLEETASELEMVARVEEAHLKNLEDGIVIKNYERGFMDERYR